METAFNGVADFVDGLADGEALKMACGVGILLAAFTAYLFS